MTMRITTQMVDASNVATIDNDLNSMDEVQQTLSTGFRINQASDDPYGESQTLALGGQLAAYKSYSANIDNGVGWLQSASTALQSVQSVINNMQTLATESANGTMSQTDLDDAAEQVLQYIGDVKQTANTQYDGSYIFSGTSTLTAPYEESVSSPDTYAGDSGSITRAIGPGSSLAINGDLHSVLGDGVAGDGGLLSTLRTIYDDMTATGGGSRSDLGGQLTALQSNLSSLEGVEASLGGAQDRMQMAATRIESLTTTTTTQRGTIEDTDVAAATLQFTTEQASYEAALQSTAAIVQESLMKFLQT